jgi:NAD(P)-dependent dehydrogenase (short-subunit alcohol dehydrogenase family)
MRLKDKVAIITGAARGIGAAFAVGFGKEGAKVVIGDIRDGSKTVAAVEFLLRQGTLKYATCQVLDAVPWSEELAEHFEKMRRESAKDGEMLAAIDIVESIAKL